MPHDWLFSVLLQSSSANSIVWGFSPPKKVKKNTVCLAVPLFKQSTITRQIKINMGKSIKLQNLTKFSIKIVSFL